MLNEVTACLEKGFELGVRWTDEDGVLNDAYESNRPENFAPACWAVIGASLYRLSGEDVYLEWTDRWMKRTAEIMEGARNSPGFREYVMGYGAMVFPILCDVVDRDILERWETAFSASYTDDAELSDCHVSAASLLCDLFLDGGREDKAGKRSGEFIAAFNRRLTSGGFLRDDDVNGHSVAHVYLTGTFLAAALLNGESDGYRVSEHDRRQVRRLLETICAWFKRANGQFHLPFLASRSIYQMYVYPMVALLSFIGEGEKARERILALLDFCRSFNPDKGVFSHTPNHLSPFAVAGLEWTYNRLNTDLGAGLVAWALLALLIDEEWTGFGPVAAAPVEDVVDTEAGYAILHGEKSRLALTLCNHDWGYHLPLQPLSVKLGNTPMIEPIADAKRDGVKHTFHEQITEPDKADPLLEPYFGILVNEAGGAYRIMEGDAEVIAADEFRLDGPVRLNLKLDLEDELIRLTYRVTDLRDDDQVVFSIPIVLWDGKEELIYDIHGGTIVLGWKGAAYRISISGTSGPWDLHMARYLHAGYGVTGNMTAPVAHESSRLQVAVTIERTA
ncbi:MAG: hypothetical protein OXH06_04875 [Gemmatimonadetes bacterium]|nr:hypothetical protein [Gemmatimonadota bacterium]MDE3259196.1 hypothetical protein [Gemmatimonadota bacterium]